jgi:hypothetical protein
VYVTVFGGKEDVAASGAVVSPIGARQPPDIA